MVLARGLTVFYDFLEAPETAAAMAEKHPPVFAAVLAYLLSATSVFLAQALAGQASVIGVSGFSLLLANVWSLGMGVVLAAVMHLFAEASGGRGKVLPLFVLLGYSELAWGLALPGVILVRVFAPESTLAMRMMFATVWLITLLFKVRSIRLNYRFSASQAWYVLLSPYVALTLGTVVLLFGAFWGVARNFVSIF